MIVDKFFAPAIKALEDVWKEYYGEDNLNNSPATSSVAACSDTNASLNEQAEAADAQQRGSMPDEIAKSIAETLEYYDIEFPLEKYPKREDWPVSDHAGGITVGQLRYLSRQGEIERLLEMMPPEYSAEFYKEEKGLGYTVYILDCSDMGDGHGKTGKGKTPEQAIRAALEGLKLLSV